MNQEPLRVEGRSPSWRRLSHRSGAFELSAREATVKVDGCGEGADVALEFSQFELQFMLEKGGVPALEAIAAADCKEVVITAKVGGSASARQLVFEWTELLTQQLERTRPLIRVRFVPDSERLAKPRNDAEWRSAQR